MTAPGRVVNPPRGEASPIGIDLRRADLYRILDEFTRAPAERRSEVIREFERAWEDLKEAMSSLS